MNVFLAALLIPCLIVLPVVWWLLFFGWAATEDPNPSRFRNKAGKVLAISLFTGGAVFSWVLAVLMGYYNMGWMVVGGLLWPVFICAVMSAADGSSNSSS